MKVLMIAEKPSQLYQRYLAMGHTRERAIAEALLPFLDAHHAAGECNEAIAEVERLRGALIISERDRANLIIGSNAVSSAHEQLRKERDDALLELGKVKAALAELAK